MSRTCAATSEHAWQDRCAAPSCSRARCCRLAPTPRSSTPSGGAGGASRRRGAGGAERPGAGPAAFREAVTGARADLRRRAQQRRPLRRGGRRSRTRGRTVDAALPPEHGDATLAPEGLLDHLAAPRRRRRAACRRGPGGGPTTTSRPWCRTRPCSPASGPTSSGCRWPTSAPGSAPPTAGRTTRRPTSPSGSTYAEETALARRLGWPTTVLDGALHLHHLVDPDAVAARRARPRGGDRRPAQDRSWSRGDDHAVTGRGTASPSSSRSVRSE